MHTIEASVLVPLGLGLMVILLMLTFFIHDRTVLTAEYASTMLEWQTSPGKWSEDKCEEEKRQWEKYLLMTNTRVLKMKAGNSIFRLKTREEYGVFNNILQIMEQNLPESGDLRLKTCIKTDPFWRRRIWKVVEMT